MKYPYAVKANGKWYRPNEDVPETTISIAESVVESTKQRNIPQIEEVQPAKVVEGDSRRRGRRPSK